MHLKKNVLVGGHHRKKNEGQAKKIDLEDLFFLSQQQLDFLKNIFYYCQMGVFLAIFISLPIPQLLIWFYKAFNGLAKAFTGLYLFLVLLHLLSSLFLL